MAKGTSTSTTDPVAQLHENIENIRRDAYQAGYSDAMRAVLDFTANVAKPAAEPVAERPASLRQPRQARAAKPPREAPVAVATPRRNRGDNARFVGEAMMTLPDHTGRGVAIQKALAGQGINMAFASIRNALEQLQARGEVSLADDGKTWTYQPSPSDKP